MVNLDAKAVGNELRQLERLLQRSGPERDELVGAIARTTRATAKLALENAKRLDAMDQGARRALRSLPGRI